MLWLNSKLKHSKALILANKSSGQNERCPIFAEMNLWAISSPVFITVPIFGRLTDDVRDFLWWKFRISVSFFRSLAAYQAGYRAAYHAGYKVWCHLISSIKSGTIEPVLRRVWKAENNARQRVCVATLAARKSKVIRKWEPLKVGAGARTTHYDRRRMTIDLNVLQIASFHSRNFKLWNPGPTIAGLLSGVVFKPKANLFLFAFNLKTVLFTIEKSLQIDLIN